MCVPPSPVPRSYCTQLPGWSSSDPRTSTVPRSPLWLCVPQGMEPGPSLATALLQPTVALPVGTRRLARVLAHLLAALSRAVPTTGVSLPFSPSVQTVLPWQRASSVTFPAKVAHHGLPCVRVSPSLVQLIIFSHICLTSPGKLLFPSKKGAGVLFS